MVFIILYRCLLHQKLPQERMKLFILRDIVLWNTLSEGAKNVMLQEADKHFFVRKIALLVYKIAYTGQHHMYNLICKHFTSIFLSRANITILVYTCIICGIVIGNDLCYRNIQLQCVYCSMI